MHTPIQRIQDYLHEQGVDVELTRVKPTVFNRSGGQHSTSWSQYVQLFEAPVSLQEDQIAMSLASMACVELIDAAPTDNVLDVCAAPGMKGLYLKTRTPLVNYFANDVSKDRIERLKRIYTLYDVQPAQITCRNGLELDTVYQNNFFDRVLLDAPCSGEGLALGGDESQAESWSPAKVKRLQQLQVRLLKASWKLLKPGGTLVYATCTLNRNENERALKKALGVVVETIERPLSLDSLPDRLSDCESSHTGAQPLLAWRIMPSELSIGFFIAVIEKRAEIA